MDQILHIGKVSAEAAIRKFCGGKHNIALVTDGAAYSLCGAEAFFNTILASLTTKITHLTVPSANPKVETVQPLRDALPSDIDGFIAVGGGTTIDTTKLLNLSLVTNLNVKSILQLKLSPPTLLPFLALPTTAGTGAEATRFAVCYDGETKYSIDFLAIRPTEVALVPDFIATLPRYQKLSTNFDAYAQAMESLWAKGATDESRAYATKALEFITQSHRDTEKDAALLNELLGAYWAGRAIDISRTTAAHAFSYYLTSHYGIPHGHAVFMVFPYILKNNAPCLCASVLKYDTIVEDVNRFHALGLTTLREFVAEKGLSWSALIDDLFAHVNLKRLGNNPCEVRKESFLN